MLSYVLIVEKNEIHNNTTVATLRVPCTIAVAELKILSLVGFLLTETNGSALLNSSYLFLLYDEKLYYTLPTNRILLLLLLLLLASLYCVFIRVWVRMVVCVYYYDFYTFHSHLQRCVSATHQRICVNSLMCVLSHVCCQGLRAML